MPRQRSRPRSVRRYLVGIGAPGEGPSEVFEGREAREAVRNWCRNRQAAHPDLAAATLFGGLIVWTLPVLICSQATVLMYLHRWTVDASHPPAWIITPYREVAPLVAGPEEREEA